MNYTDSKVYNNLALAFAGLGQYGEALEAFKKGGSEAQAYNNLGCILMSRGKYADAVRCFERAIELDPIFYAKASENLQKAKSGLAYQQ